jgi:glycosyltransferase involved in cell wall biosynthesis
MSDALRLSVVIPTFNRRQRLSRVLDGLDRQTVSPETFEVVIVDDGSTDDTLAWLGEHGRRPYAVNVVSQKNGGPSRARNAGVNASRGALILFLDDDVEPTPPLIAEHLKMHDAEPNVVVMGPMASVPHYSQPWVKWEQEKLEAQYEAMIRGDYAPTFRQFWTGNASVARDDLLGAGGFDPSLPRAEDIDLGRRLHERGLEFRFNPAARGLHHAERSLESWIAMHRYYGALEVQIFGGLGEDELLGLLAGNWSRIHSLTRWLVLACLNRPARTKAAERALDRLLRLSAETNVALGASHVCGALANLTYWSASAEALGRTRIERVFRTGDRLRRGEPAS